MLKELNLFISEIIWTYSVFQITEQQKHADLKN